MRETKLWERIRPHLLLWGEADRVENSVVTGMSDVYYNIAGKTGWIETKVAKGDWIYFEKFQPNWMAKHVRQGARVFVMFLDKDDAIRLYPASVILGVRRELYDKWQRVFVPDLPRASHVLEPPYRSWKSVKEILTS